MPGGNALVLLLLLICSSRARSVMLEWESISSNSPCHTLQPGGNTWLGCSDLLKQLQPGSCH